MPGAIRRGAPTTAVRPRSPPICLTTYPFGVEEHQYDSSGNPLGTGTYYYTFAGRLIGVLLGTTMEFVLTDDLGSVRTAITNQAGAATVVGYMGYGPFGFLQYHAGQTGTNKGYTGQYNDPLSGLDYYVARYYDPVVGLFLSADTVQSTLQGFDPYAYVGNNPETVTDPTGCDPGWQFWLGVAVVVVAAAVILAAPVVVPALLAGAVADGVITAATVSAVTYTAAGTGMAVLGGTAVGMAQTDVEWYHHQNMTTDQYLTTLGANMAWDGATAGAGYLAGGVLSPATSGVGALGGLTGAVGGGAVGTVTNPIPVPQLSSGGSGSTTTPAPAGPTSVRHIVEPSSHAANGGTPRPRPPVRFPTPTNPHLPVGLGYSPIQPYSPTRPSSSYYTITSGDTLWGIAMRFYGNGAEWQRIYQANIGIIGGNPNPILPGERLSIPH